MNDLFLVLFLISFIAVIIGLIKPQLVIRWGSLEKRNRKSVLKFYGIGLILFFILFGITIDNTTSKSDDIEAANSSVEAKNLTPEEKIAADKIAATDLDTKITALGDANSITLNKSADVKELRTSYEALTEDQKGLVTKLDTLTIAENMIDNLQIEADKLAEEKASEEKAAAEKVAEERAAAEKAAEEKAAAEKAEADRIAYDTGITYDQLARTPDDYIGKKVKLTGTVIQVMENTNETDLRIAVDDDYDNVILVGYDPKITSVRVLEDDTVTLKGVSAGLYTYQSTLGGNITIPLILVDEIAIN